MRVIFSLTLLLGGIFVPTALPAASPWQDEPGLPPPAAEDGFLVDFDNRPIQAVLSALAEAAGLNVILSDLPNERMSLRMGEPVPKAHLLDLIRNIVEANNLSMTMEGSLIRIERRRRGQMMPNTNVYSPEIQLFSYRLRHTSAAQLAPVLMNLVAGTGGRRMVPGIQTEPVQNGGRPGLGGGVRTSLAIPAPNAPVAPQENRFDPHNPAVQEMLRQRAEGQEISPQRMNEMMRQLRQRQGQGGGGNNGGDGGDFMENGLSNFANEVRIVAEEATNTLLIRATATDWELIKKVIETVDLRPLQALIEVTIVEVTRSKSLDLGVNAKVTYTKNGRQQELQLPGVESARDFVARLTGGSGTVDFAVALSALASRGELRVVSSPIVIAQNNRQAVLNVGSSRPFIQVSQTVPNDPTGRVETIQYLDVGTTLTITPTINADGYVNLAVTQTANTATNEIQFDAPVLSKREATTQVFLRNGQTTVIGGLADNVRDRVRSGIPVLSWIPILGALFRSTHDSDVQSELYLFLTPHIISEDADIDRIRSAVQEESDLLRQVPLQQRIPVPSVPNPVPDSPPSPVRDDDD